MFSKNEGISNSIQFISMGPSFHESSLDLKIVVLGPLYVGKTSIINRYCNGSFMDKTLSTIGAGFFTNTMMVDDTEVTTMLWDTSGQERFRSVAPSLLRGANGMILVYDLTSIESFEAIDAYMELFLDTCKFDTNYEMPVLLLGNKSDLDPKISDEMINSWMKKNHVVHNFKVSAKSGDGVDSALKLFIKSLINPEFSSSDECPINIIVKKEPISHSSCC